MMFQEISKGDIVFVEYHYQDMMDFYEVSYVGENFIKVVYEYNRDFGDPESFMDVPISKCRLVCKFKNREDKVMK